MDASYTRAQNDYRLKFRRWLDQNLPQSWGGSRFRGPDDGNENAKFQAKWERQLYEAGYSGVAWPREYGGQGLSIVEYLIVNEELGRRAAPEGINAIGRELVGPILLAAGTEEQKRHYIPRILRVDDIWCQGFSEPGAGSDLAGLRTRATRDGSDWLLNGQKVWTSYAQHADWCILLARTDPAATKHRGITLFLVDMKTPGISIRPLTQITGRAEFNEVFFDDVRVPDRMRIGDVDDGWNIAVRVLGFERATTRLYRQARFMHEFEQLMSLCVANGTASALHENAHYRQRIGAMLAELTILRLHNMKVASRIAQGARIGPEASLIKLFWSEMHQRFADLAMDTLSALSLRTGPDAERFQDVYLQSRAETIYAGTSQIQRNIIAERILGLPR